MVDAYPMPDVQAVRKTIKQLRDVPANTTGAGQDVLQLISDYIVELGPKDGPVHWFCPKATQLTIDCATFLLRLHAYESSSIQTWRNLLTRCLRGCCDCVRGLAEAKVTSRHTYVVLVLTYSGSDEHTGSSAHSPEILWTTSGQISEIGRRQ